MENNGSITYLSLSIMGLLVATPFFVLAYDNQTAHPALTDEAVDLFDMAYPNAKLSDSDKASIKKGSIEEDDAPRWMNHFYDPIYNRGLWGYPSSKVWALDSKNQALLDSGYRQGSILATVSGKPYDSRTDYSWDRAIYDYVWADKARGLEALGHILHLLEDSAVPDHVRNDAHPPVAGLGSPYEEWTKRFTVDNTDGMAKKIYDNKLLPMQFNLLQEYFHSLAKYSNENFFSRDTILDKEYKKPEFGSTVSENFHNGDSTKFIYNQSVKTDSFRLVNVKTDLITGKNEYSIEDADDLVLQDYWTHLSKEAILHSAGVIRLFLEEANRERTNKTRLSSNKSLTDTISSSISSFFGGGHDNADIQPLIGELPANAFDISTPVVSEPSVNISKPTVSANLPQSENPITQSQYNINPVIIQPVINDTPAPVPVVETIMPKQTTDKFPAIIPGFGGGGSAPTPAVDNLADNNIGGNGGGNIEPHDDSPLDITPPSAPIILEPHNNSSFTSPDVQFRGTGEPASVIFQNCDNAQVATTSDSGSWNIKLSIGAQGTTTINFYAKDSAGNISSSTPFDIFMDTNAPDITLVSSTCAKSLSSDTCLVATSTLSISWSSQANDINHFEVSCLYNGSKCDNFDFTNTGATSTVYTSKHGDGKYVFSVRAYDNIGNVGDEATKEIYISSRPVVINEVAWAGTATGSNDEWIELYNRTDQSVSLDNWILFANTSNKPYIPLSGIIAPHSYYLLERTDDNAVSDVKADLIYGNDGTSWALNNNPADILILSYASTTIDKTILCFGNAWCGGSTAPKYFSMERVNPDVDGSSANNWASSLGEFIKNGVDANGTALNATPKARNSANYLISVSGLISSDKTLVKRDSPYIIGRQGLTLNNDITLTIEPGVVIKFVAPNEPSFYIKGSIKANGTSDNPIVFTSFYDDEYGGDTNGDGACDKTLSSASTTCPQVGTWKQIDIKSSSSGSTFDNVIFRYGGRWFNDGSIRSMVVVEKTDADFRNSIFEYSMKHGLVVSGGGLIEHNIFRNNDKDTDSAGLLSTGNATIKGNTFSNNSIGLELQGGSANVENNTFSDNKSYAVTAQNGLNSFSNNGGAGNGENGIKLAGALNASTTSFALHHNDLPYIIGSGVYQALEIPNGSNVEIDPGVILRARSDGIIQVNGTLTLNGDSKESVLFAPLGEEDLSVPKSWRGINVGKTGLFKGNGFTVRSGGSGCPFGAICAGLMAIEGKVDIKNARFEKNYSAGMILAKSVGSLLSDVEFIDHNEPKEPAGNPTRAVGLVLSNSDIGIGTLSFSNNTLGVSSTNSTITHLDPYAVTFSGNTTDMLPADLF